MDRAVDLRVPHNARLLATNVAAAVAGYAARRVINTAVDTATGGVAAAANRAAEYFLTPPNTPSPHRRILTARRRINPAQSRINRMSYGRTRMRKRRSFRRRRPYRRSRKLYRQRRTTRPKLYGRTRVRSSRLNTNMRRNDFDSIRDLRIHGEINASSLAVSYQRHESKVTDFALATTYSTKYKWYKMKNVQIILRPKYQPWAFGTLSIPDTGFDHYGYVWIADESTGASSTAPTYETIQRTPGVRKFNIYSTRPIVINVPIKYHVKETIEDDATINKAITKPLGWTEFESSNDIVVYRVYTWLPKMASGAVVFQTYKVECYATFVFRENLALIPPN